MLNKNKNKAAGLKVLKRPLCRNSHWKTKSLFKKTRRQALGKAKPSLSSAQSFGLIKDGNQTIFRN